MGFVDGVVEAIKSKSDALTWISDEKRNEVRATAAKLPAFAEGIDRWWDAHRDDGDGLSDESLRGLYDVLAGSGISPLESFDQLRAGLASPAAAPELTPELLYRWGADVNRYSPRVAGTQGMDDASDYILRQLRSFGIRAWSEPLNFKGVFFHSWSFDILGAHPEAITSFPQNNVGFGDVTAELVSVGRGTGEEDYEGKDVHGKIVFVDWGSLDEEMSSDFVKERNRLLQLFDRAHAHGAAAMVGFYDDTVGNSLRVIEPGIKPVGGSNVWGPDEAGPDNQFVLPVLNIGRNDGRRIQKRLESGERITARVAIDGVRKTSTTQIVAGVIPGQTNEVISVACHSDTAFAGGVCDTCGIVGTLALAKHFASLPLSERRKSILFFFDSYHVWGNCCQVANQFLARHSSLANEITSFIWLDHFSDGRADTDGVAVVDANPVYWPLLALALARRGIKPVAVPIAGLYSMCALAAHQRRGVPSFTIQKTNAEMLGTEDTWSKFDPDVLHRDVLLHVDFLEALQRLEVPPIAKEEPVTGCGVLFDELELPEYGPAETYEPEPTYPLYVGGADGEVAIYRDYFDKDAYKGQA